MMHKRPRLVHKIHHNEDNEVFDTQNVLWEDRQPPRHPPSVEMKLRPLQVSIDDTSPGDFMRTTEYHGSRNKTLNNVYHLLMHYLNQIAS